MVFCFERQLDFVFEYDDFNLKFLLLKMIFYTNLSNTLKTQPETFHRLNHLNLVHGYLIVSDEN